MCTCSLPYTKFQVRFFCSPVLLLLVIPCRKATNSAGPGARQSSTDSAQHVARSDKNSMEFKSLAFNTMAIKSTEQEWI